MHTCLHTNRTGEVVVLFATGLVQAEPHLNLLFVISTAIGVPEAGLCNLRGLARTEIEIELLFLEAASAVRLQCGRLHQRMLNFVEGQFSEVHIGIVRVNGSAEKEADLVRKCHIEADRNSIPWSKGPSAAKNAAGRGPFTFSISRRRWNGVLRSSRCIL